MRWAAWLIAWLASASAAAQGSVILLSGSPQSLSWSTALQVELAPRSAQVMLAGAPGGMTLADRALFARGLAHEAGADAAIWMENEADGTSSVRAVSASSELVAWAPLSGPNVDGRVFALVAVSLLDELLAPPQAITITIRVPGPEQLGNPQTPPPISVLPPPPLRPRGAYVDLGAIFAGVNIGAEVSAGVFLHHNVRLGFHARGTFSLVDFSNSARAGDFGGCITSSLAYLTDGDDGRFEVALDLGALMALTHSSSGSRLIALPGFLVGGFVGWSWTLSDAARIGFRFGPYGAFVDSNWVPAGMGSLFITLAP